jgi:bifunctional non-homologous end joining protein LigD
MPPLDSAKHRENIKLAASAVGRATRPIDLSTIPGVRKGTLPASITPQLARIAPAPPSGADWLHEIKFDGYRMLS